MMTEPRILKSPNRLVGTLRPRILTGLSAVIEVKGESTRKHEENGETGAPAFTESADFLPRLRKGRVQGQAHACS
jgi:hypothetical protein